MRLHRQTQPVPSLFSENLMFKSISLSALALMLTASISFARTYDVTDYGARGDGRSDDARAIQAAIDRCSSDGGGSVVFPSGKTFLSGPLRMASNVDLHLSPNSTLLANPDESVYTESAFGANRGEGMMWLYGKDIENFSISGTGRIDGNAVAFMGAELDDSFELKSVTA